MISGLLMEKIISKVRSTFSRAKPEELTERAAGSDSYIGAEAPIRTAVQDRLRRVDFAQRIASVLSVPNPKEGRIFAIRGGWGFGKSSLKNLVMEKLDAQENAASWLDFNPWQWGDSDSIARALFGEIANKLGGDYSSDSAARAAMWRRYGSILAGAAEPLKEISGSTQITTTILTNASVIAIASAIGFDLPTVAKLAAALALISILAPVIGRFLRHLGRDRSSDSLDEIRKTLEKSLSKLHRPLVIFVDDIDRLEPDQIRILLRQVKSNASLPNIIFVLLFQPSIVEQALNPIAGGDGRSFLEKIVQVNIDLPAVPPSVVHRIFSEELSALAGNYATEKNGFSQKRWGNVFVGCIQPRLRNIRDARRLLSSIALYLPSHATLDTYEVNILDFFALETLRVFEPALHATLFRERDLVLRGNAGQQNVDKTSAQFLSSVPEELHEWAKETLKELFPPLAWAFGGANYGTDWSKTWLNERRVCSSRYFPRYFELLTPIGELSERGFVDFLAATDDQEQLEKVMVQFEESGLNSSLAARLDEAVERLPIDNAAILLPQMFKLGQKLAGRQDLDPFGSPWVSAWRAASWFLRRIPNENRGALAVDALRQSQALSVGAILIHLNDPAAQTESEAGHFNPELDVATVEAMKAEWLLQVRSRAAQPGRLISEPDLASLLYRWRDYTGSLEEARAWVTSAINTDDGFVSLIDKLMTRGMSHSFGDKVSTPYYTFDRQTIGDFIGVDVARTKIQNITIDEYPNYSTSIETLRKQLNVWTDDPKRDTPDE